VRENKKLEKKINFVFGTKKIYWLDDWILTKNIVVGDWIFWRNL